MGIVRRIMNRKYVDVVNANQTPASRPMGPVKGNSLFNLITDWMNGQPSRPIRLFV